jgi:hypothetical protein
MKKAYSLALVMALAMLPIASPAVAQSTGPDQPMRVTLYSPETYKLTNAPPLSNGRSRPDLSRAYFSFTSGQLSTRRNWDLSYGVLGGDWFVVGFGVGDDRSAIRDLGKLAWNSKFNVPVVAPLPELKPGEPRYIATVRKKGQGWASLQVLKTPDQIDFDDFPQVSPPVSPIPETNTQETNTNGSKDAKEPESAPVLAKIVSGHLYVIHIVKAQSDFYVLVHVDSLKEGDKCTISWKRIPSP